MVTGVDTFGAQLKHERESRNVALDEIARATKIRMRYLQALEEGQHERLPGIVFAKGYVRAYAETIGANADRLVAAYVEEQRSLGRLETEASQEQVLEALAAAVKDKPGRSSGTKAVFLGIFALLALGAIGWFGLRPLLGAESGAAEPVDLAAAAPEEVVNSAPEYDDAIETIASSTVDESMPPPNAEPSAMVADEPSAEETEVREITRNEAAAAPVEPSVETVELPERVVETVPVSTHDASLTIPDYGVGTGVERRSLVGEGTTFETGTQVVFWTRVLGGGSGESVRHVWSHEGAVTGTVELSIGAAHWRTYSRQTLRQSGEWTVEALDEEGNVLARRTFVASPA